MPRRLSPAIPIFAMVALLALAGARAQADGPAGQVLAYGNDDHYWIARVETVTGEKGTTEYLTTIQSRGKFTDRWQFVAQLDSRAVELASRGDDLAVLLEGGSWMSVWAGGGSAGRPLPSGVRIIALAGENGVLWALGRGDLSQAIPSTLPSTQVAFPADADRSPSTMRAASAPHVPAGSIGPATDAGAAHSLGLYELTSADWILRAKLPDSLRAERPDQVSLTIAKDRPIVAIAGRDPHLSVLRLEVDGRFSELGTLGRESDWIVLGQPPRPALWMASGSPAGSIVFLDRLDEAPRVLDSPDGLKPGDEKALTAAAGALRLVYPQDGKLFEQSYSRDGELTGKPLPIPKVEAIESNQHLYDWLTLPVMIVLTLVLFNPARQKNGQTLRVGSADDGGRTLIIAPLRIRFVAGVVDALPLVILELFIFSQVQRDAPEQVYEVMQAWSGLWMGAMAVYFMHTLVSEMLTGRTLGKWIMGLRVVSVTGQRPGAMSVLIRNVLRVFEVSLLGIPLLFIVFTPLSQRLGDLAAGTVVIADHAEEKRDSEE